MRAAFFIVCVLGFGFSAVDSIASREAIERNTAMFQRYNEQYEKSELFKEDKITKFRKLIERIKEADLTVSFFDDTIDSMLIDNDLEPCLFIKCRWGAELLSDLVKGCFYDYALRVENFLLSKMNEDEFLPVSSTPFDFEGKLLECMSKTNTPALNKYLISPYGKIKERFFERLYEMGCCMTKPPIKVTYKLKQGNQFWYVSNLAVGSEIIRKNYLSEESILADLFRVFYSILKSFSFNNMFDLVSIVTDSKNDLVQALGLLEVFVGNWYIIAPGFWAQPLGGVDDRSSSFYGESYLLQNEDEMSEGSESPLGSSEEPTIDQYFASIPESGIVLSGEDEDRWERISEKLFPYYDYIPAEVTNRERKRFVLYLRYNRLGYDLEEFTKTEGGRGDESQKREKQQQLERIKKDYYNTFLSLIWMPCVQRSKYFWMYFTCLLLREDFSLDLSCYKHFEKITVFSFFQFRFSIFYEILMEQIKSKKSIESLEWLEFIENTKILCDIFVRYDWYGLGHEFMRKMKEILKTELPENSWKEIELFEQEIENLIKARPWDYWEKSMKVIE